MEQSDRHERAPVTSRSLEVVLIGREDHIPAAGGSYPCALDELVAAVNARTQQTMQMRDHNKEDHSM